MQQQHGNTRILVTGFGPFPGVRNNPTCTLVHALAKYKARLTRLGIDLLIEVLPVVYAEVGPRLETLARTLRPDAVLHLGLAARRKTISLESRAINRVTLVRRDARKAAAPDVRIIARGPDVIRSTFPARLVGTALARAGIESRLSIDAGTYVCNQTLYLSLARIPARSIGFLHVPRPAGRQRLPIARHRSQRPRPTFEEMTKAVLLAIIVIATALRQNATRPAPARYLRASEPLDPKSSLA